MKNNLLVTLADKNYIDQAKQLFSSVYFNAGWKGDYMLLSHDISEKDLEWFKDRGILITRCKPLYNKMIGRFSPVILSKFYLFTSEFKKWDNIVFLDADIIVQASLEDLTKVKSFAAVTDVDHELKEQFINLDSQLFNRLKETYNLEELSFNVGVLAFNANIIKDDTFFKLKKLFELYNKILFYPEQAILNLFFYKKWQALSPIYNTFFDYWTFMCHIKPKNIRGIILHFIGNDEANLPWTTTNYFYLEWKYNLDKADSIDLKKIQANKKWSQAKIILHSSYLKLRFFLIKPREFCYYHFKKFNFFVAQRINRYIGQIGIFLKNNFPKLYFSLKRLKVK